MSGDRVRLEPSWKARVGSAFDGLDMLALAEFLRAEKRAGKIIHPSGPRIFAALDTTPFEQVKVTCRHVQWLRDRLPAFEGQPDRYVVWGEGTTDEMCLGMLQVTRP